MYIRALLGTCCAFLWAPLVHSQPQNADQLLDQMALEIGLVREAVTLAQKGAIDEAMAMVADKDGGKTLIRCVSVAGNLRNLGRPDLAGAFARAAIGSVGDEWNALRLDRRRAEVYMRKAELAWEFLGDRELASRYARLGNRAVQALRSDEVRDFERLERLTESIDSSRRSFRDSGIEGSRGGIER